MHSLVHVSNSQSPFCSINLEHWCFRSRNTREFAMRLGTRWNTLEILTASLQLGTTTLLRAGICWEIVFVPLDHEVPWDQSLSYWLTWWALTCHCALSSEESCISVIASTWLSLQSMQTEQSVIEVEIIFLQKSSCEYLSGKCLSQLSLCKRRGKTVPFQVWSNYRITVILNTFKVLLTVK